jgi:Mg-chelatase subunit ChlD
MHIVWYKKIFFAKILWWVLLIILGIVAYRMMIEPSGQILVFVVDMHESMATQDISDRVWIVRTRQQAASQYMFHAAQDATMPVAIIRLWYYPDYILPPTQDREYINQYISSLAVSPLANTIVYTSWSASLEKYIKQLPSAQYVLITDKESTAQSVAKLIPSLQVVMIGEDIQQREDTYQQQWWVKKNKSYFSWIFVGIILLWIMLL